MQLSDKDRHAKQRLFERDHAKELARLRKRLISDFQFFILIWVMGYKVLGPLHFIELWLTATLAGMTTWRLLLWWKFRKS
jgi:hypothetical protein